jgi:beta-glucanase (GH16 family)
MLVALWPLAALPEDRAPGFIEVFDDRDWRRNWYLSNFDMGENFVTGWRSELISDDGPGRVGLTLEPASADATKPFLGAEMQRRDGHHYGTYEVVMRPGRGDGLVSAFFTYTGPHFGDPHDEIDFEFLGRDTTRVWINVFKDGDQMGGRWVPLGFDAASAPRLYRFEWRPDEIVWFAQGEEIARVPKETFPIPETPGRLFVNIWAGNEGMAEWLAVAPDDLQAMAEVRCVSYRPLGTTGLECSDLPPSTLR